MSQSNTAERRAHPRQAVLAGIRFYHAASRRELPARTLDLSRGGLSMLVPPYAPIQEGEPIQILSLPPVESDAPEGSGSDGDLPGGDAGPRDLERPLDATVLRVDRAALPTTGQVRLAVRFRQPLAQRGTAPPPRRPGESPRARA